MVKFSIKLLSILATTTNLIQCAQIISCKVDGTVALTFDDGPTQYTNELIETLNKYGVKATFFINAHNYAPYADENKSVRDIIKKAYQSGHQIASHTYAHMIENDVPTMKKSFTKMDNFVKSIIGVTPKYFRAPGGNCDTNCIKTIEDMGYRVIKWDVDTSDWKATSSNDPISSLEQAFNQNKKNYLVKMHDSKPHTVQETVPWILKSDIIKKYKFVTVAECLGDKTYGYKEEFPTSSLSKDSPNNNNNKNNNNEDMTTLTKTVTAVINTTIAPVNTIVPENNTIAHPATATIDNLATLPYNSYFANTQQVNIDSGSMKQYNNTMIMIIVSFTIFIINLI